MLNAGSKASQKLAQCHQEQLELCLALERIADGLPGFPNPDSLRPIDGQIVPMMRRFARQWAVAFAALAVAVSDTPIAPLLRDVELQDQEDIGQAEEIQTTLNEMKSAQAGLCPEAFGYLLRGFVTSRRRRVSLERALFQSCTSGRFS